MMRYGLAARKSPGGLEPTQTRSFNSTYRKDTIINVSFPASRLMTGEPHKAAAPRPVSSSWFSLNPPPASYWPSKKETAGSTQDLDKAIEQFEVNPELQVDLFASEPMLVNPTNIDVDHRGRVWVAEVVNYRNQMRNGNKPARQEGDRILILEDTDSNGQADKQTVFYQGTDIDSVHGICLLGDRLLVSAGADVFYLIDKDGDSVADEKQLLFTKISGVQHDHGIHAFVFGPDGKLYFNFGNSGRTISDAEGKPIVDIAGNEVNNSRQPYQEGMIFRCNPDGSQFETLAWNFQKQLGSLCRFLWKDLAI